ncbi:MAG TPA: YciI family protein [Solirubrobacteraceae bacterium]
MQYALLAYGRPATPREAAGPIDGAIAEVLGRPYVSGWVRLHSDESATTLRNSEGKSLLTDGPFIDSKEYLAGLIIIEAENLDGALEVAQELQDARTSGAIEVRPVFEGLFRAA